MSVRAKPVMQMAIAGVGRGLLVWGRKKKKKDGWGRERHFGGGGGVIGERGYLRILVLCRRLHGVRDQPRHDRGGRCDPRLWSGLLSRRSEQRGGGRLFRWGFRFEEGWIGLAGGIFGRHWDWGSGREGWFSIGGMRRSEGGWVWSRRVGRSL